MAKPSVLKAPERNLVKTHVLAIDHDNITAKDVRLFAQVERTATRDGLNPMSTDEMLEGWQGI